MGVTKFSKLGFPQLWRPITLCVNLRLRWTLKQNCTPHREIYNNMWHATYTQRNWGNSWHLVVGSQIDNLTPGLSFGHNLCFNYSNASYKSILDIYVLRAFRWYKKILKLMGFDLCTHPLKIWESIGIPTPKVRAHLGVWGFILSHSLVFLVAWNVILGLTFGLHLCKPLLWLWAQG